MFIKLEEGQKVTTRDGKRTGVIKDSSGSTYYVETEVSLGKNVDGTENMMTKLEKWSKMDTLPVDSPQESHSYNPVELLANFHKAFNYKRSEEPVVLSAEDVFKRIVFIQEELVELLAASVDTVGEFQDYLLKLHEKHNEAFLKERPKVEERQEDNLKNPDKMNGELSYDKLTRIVEQTDALVDLLVFVYGTADMAGIDLRPMFNTVMESNMSKLDDNGKPIYNEFGKIQKSKNFIAPEARILEEIQQQMRDSETL